jgi:hypothetical protein
MDLPIFNTYMNFSRIIFGASQFLLCLFWISIRLKNRCLQHPCIKNLCKIAQASKNLDSNTQHFLFGFANTFMISLHALCTPKLPIPLQSILYKCYTYKCQPSLNVNFLLLPTLSMLNVLTVNKMVLPSL